MRTIFVNGEPVVYECTRFKGIEVEELSNIYHQSRLAAKTVEVED